MLRGEEVTTHNVSSKVWFTLVVMARRVTNDSNAGSLGLVRSDRPLHAVFPSQPTASYDMSTWPLTVPKAPVIYPHDLPSFELRFDSLPSGKLTIVCGLEELAEDGHNAWPADPNTTCSLFSFPEYNRPVTVASA